MLKHFFIILFLSSISYSQDYRLINKAEKLLNSNTPNFKKIDNLLKRASKSDYGFCANAKNVALSEIEYLKARKHFIKAEYSKSLSILESNTVWSKPNCSDSLKVLCLFKIHGKETIRNLILEHKNKLTSSCASKNYNTICLQLQTIDYIFCFHDQNNGFSKKDETILKTIEYTNFYTLLFEDETNIEID
jgi:hypothetical protein